MSEADSGVRLQKHLASQGIASRREVDQWIQAGRIKVNGEVAVPGTRVRPEDSIAIDGREVPRARTRERTRVLLYNKPVGEICTRSDPEGRRTVFEHLPTLRNSRWLSVGRLDIHSAGLLLFTNHGELAARLTHPSSNIDREYAVRVDGEVPDEALEQLRAGVELDDGTARFTDIQLDGGEGRNRWYHVCVMEGRNREVRRLFDSQGLTVARLKRVRFGPVVLPRGLPRGTLTEFTDKEVVALAGLVDLRVNAPGPARPDPDQSLSMKQAARSAICSAV